MILGAQAVEETDERQAAAPKQVSQTEAGWHLADSQVRRA
jgi:hypothetical protein